MIELSVIVPVYNTNINYFFNCLKSIASSSIKNMEVIIIDDGSSIDYSELQQAFPNFKFVKTENQGSLHARLFGLSLARGEYVAFIDSDDIISFDYLQASLICAKNLNADIVFNDWAFLTHNSKFVCSKDSTIKENFVLENNAVLSKYFSSHGCEHSYYVLWNKIYRREVLLKAKNEIEKLNLNKLVFAEDVLLTFFAFTFSKKIANTHSGYYFYRVHNEQEIYVNSKEKFISHVSSMAKVFGIMKDYLLKIDKFDEYSDLLKKWINLMTSSDYTVAKNSKYADCKDFIKQSYKVNKIGRFKFSSQKAYASHKLLPSNIDEIENEINEIFSSTKTLQVYAKKNSYAYNRLKHIKNIFNKKYVLTNNSKNSDVKIAKEIYPFKLRLIHNNLIYRISIFLFPKGSKLRKFFKSKF